MKKIIIGCLVLSTISLANSNKYIEAKIGTEIYSKYSQFLVDGDEFLGQNTRNAKKNREDLENGFEVSLEFMKEYNKYVDLGLGVAYQRHSTRKISLQGELGGDYDSVPIYFVGKFKIPTESNYKPYFKFDIGYSFNKNEEPLKYPDGRVEAGLSVTDGSYFALGGGVEYKNFVAELMYGKTQSKFQDSYGVEDSGDYNKLTLSVGYKFNL